MCFALPLDTDPEEDLFHVESSQASSTLLPPFMPNAGGGAAQGGEASKTYGPKTWANAEQFALAPRGSPR